MPKKRKQVPVENEEDSDQYDDEIDSYHRQGDKILLDSDDDAAQGKESEEEEVYPLLNNDFDSSSDDDEEIAFMKKQLKQLKRNTFKQKLGSDLEDEEEEEGEEEDVQESQGWGDKRKNYYGGDVRGNRIDADEDGRAVLELEEGLQIAKRHADLMSEEDFMLPSSSKEKTKKKKKKGQKDETEDTNLAQPAQTGSSDVVKIQMDFSKLSKKEAIKAMEKLYPGYVPLVNDFNAKAGELKERVLPLMLLIKKGQLTGPGADFVKQKFRIISSYLTLGAFYMYLVENREPDVAQHPVINRLLQFQQFYNRLMPVDKRLKGEIDDLLAKIAAGEDLGALDTTFATPASDKKRKAESALKLSAKKKKLKAEANNAKVEEDDSSDDGEVVFGKLKAESDEEEEEEDEEAERRRITYQMEKNKGYMSDKPAKKKEKRNPRVKHRSKFRRAQIRRKGQVRDYKPPVNAYKGELTGIRAGIIRSRKLK